MSHTQRQRRRAQRLARRQGAPASVIVVAMVDAGDGLRTPQGTAYPVRARELSRGLELDGKRLAQTHRRALLVPVASLPAGLELKPGDVRLAMPPPAADAGAAELADAGLEVVAVAIEGGSYRLEVAG